MEVLEITIKNNSMSILPDNFSDRSAETDKKRLAKPFYSKTILQIVLSTGRFAKSSY